VAWCGGQIVTIIQVRHVTDFAALGERWRDLEQRAAGSFFQSWAWTGCLAAERFPSPLLVEATERGRTVALALFNRVRRGFGLPRLFLGETGNAVLDCPYIEDNGVLAEAGREDALTEACLRAVAKSHVLVLSGVGPAMLRAARRAAGAVWIRKQNEAPFVDLAALRRGQGDYLAARSANTRQQIRRSDRSYAAGGGLTVHQAETPAAAHAMLDAMAALHQASWQARGQPGIFATPFFARFHHALIDSAFPHGQVALTAVRSGATVVGVLYNFSFYGHVSAYQSGFNYAAAGVHGKSGLTCHHAAIRDALDRGCDVYEFLSGDDRYKRSLADGSKPQYWVEAGPMWSPRLLSRRMWSLAGR
jgi:CelD/BcsL family acetyltransferase involved in cellulose biosynthesis